ncbi:MAG: ATP-dependent Clp protease ATP-binding subunit ClpA, partial [Pseudomonadota bacterium]
GEDMDAINKLFTPEFRNRLDAIVPFSPLPADVVHRVVEKFVMQLEAQLADRNVTFELSEDAIEWLAGEGYDEKMGARPLGRVIQEHIKRPLADQVLFGDLKKGGTVKVTVATDEDGKTTLALEAIADSGPNRSAVDGDESSDDDPDDGGPNPSDESGGGGSSMVPKVPLSS